MHKIFVIIWQSNGFILQMIMKPTFQYFVRKKDNT